MSEPKKPPPLPLSEVRRRLADPKLKIVMARQDAARDLRPYVDRVLAAVKASTGRGGAVWVSDQSCLSDLFDSTRDRSQDQLLYDQVGDKLGLSLDHGNDDDHFIVKIALKLKRREVATS